MLVHFVGALSTVCSDANCTLKSTSTGHFSLQRPMLSSWQQFWSSDGSMEPVCTSGVLRVLRVLSGELRVLRVHQKCKPVQSCRGGAASDTLPGAWRRLLRARLACACGVHCAACILLTVLSVPARCACLADCATCHCAYSTTHMPVHPHQSKDRIDVM